MAQTIIQGSFLGDGTVTGVKIGADFISAQTALASGLATTDEIIVSDAGVIKRMDISVLEIAATQITASGTLPVLNGAALTALTAANITASGTLPALNGAALTALTAANITASGTLPALNGAALTALTAANITASGTLPALNGAALTALTAANITASGTLPALNGAALTALNGTQVTSGTVPVAQLGSSGTRSSSTFLNGANAWAAAGGGKLEFVGTDVADNSSTVLQVTGLDSTYGTYMIAISDVTPASNDVVLYFRFGTSSGQYDGGSTDYKWHKQTFTVGNSNYDAENSGGDSKIEILGDATNGGVGSAAGKGCGAVLWLHRPGDGTMEPMITGTYMQKTAGGGHVGGAIFGVRTSVIAVDRLQIFFDAGNINTGRLTVWGVAHS